LIEMHLGDDDEYGNDGDDEAAEDSVYSGRWHPFWSLVWSTPSLAIASLVLGLASLTIVQAATEIGDSALLGSHSRNPSNLLQLRVTAAVRLVIALIAVGLAIAGATRLLALDREAAAADELGPEPPESRWVHAVIGAACLTALIAALVNVVSLIYALQATTPSGSPFN
jgi:hypothetical protein